MIPLIPRKTYFYGCRNRPYIAELTEFFNYFLHKMEENGVMRKLRRNWTYVPNEAFWTADAVTLGYDNAAFPFLALAWGIAASIAVLFAELAYFSLSPWLCGKDQEEKPRYRRRRRNRNTLMYSD